MYIFLYSLCISENILKIILISFESENFLYFIWQHSLNSKLLDVNIFINYNCYDLSIE